MGVTDGFQGIELKNGNSVVSMDNNGLLNIQADTNKRLWMGHTEEESSGVGLRNDESRIVLADNGNIDLSSQNIGLYAAGDIVLSSQNINLNAANIEIEAPTVEIASSDVDIASSSVDIKSSGVDIESSYIKIRAKKDF
jgi:hypothetical protein